MRLIFGFIVVGILIVGGIASAKLSGSLEKSAIAARLKPIGTVAVDEVAVSADQQTTVTPKTAPQQGRSAKQIYTMYCKACHAIGLAGAPKLTDLKVWADRLKQGKAVLLEHVQNGYKAMPPKGGCLACTEAEFKRTIDFMISGG